MKILNFKNSLIAGLALALIALLVFNKCSDRPKADNNPLLFQDTVFLSQWRKERKEKQALVQVYEIKITQLQRLNKTLWQSSLQSKQHLYSYRKKEDMLQSHLQNAIEHFSQKDSSINDTITPLIHELDSVRDRSDQQCDTTITLLEKSVLNRDSIIQFQKQIEIQLQDFNKQQALQNEYLTNQLNDAYKQQKKKSRQNKLLSAGLLILSGITATVLVIHSQR
jgi:hypothetical protein